MILKIIRSSCRVALPCELYLKFPILPSVYTIASHLPPSNFVSCLFRHLSLFRILSAPLLSLPRYVLASHLRRYSLFALRRSRDIYISASASIAFSFLSSSIHSLLCARTQSIHLSSLSNLFLGRRSTTSRTGAKPNSGTLPP